MQPITQTVGTRQILPSSSPFFGAYLLLNCQHESISFEDGWRLRKVMLVALTMVNINPPLKIFDSSSFLVQMVLGVLHDLRLFLAC